MNDLNTNNINSSKLRKDINLLIDNLEDKQTNNSDLNIVKLSLIKYILSGETFWKIISMKRMIRRIAKYRSKKKNIESKTNNFRKLLNWE